MHGFECGWGLAPLYFCLDLLGSQKGSGPQAARCTVKHCAGGVFGSPLRAFSHSTLQRKHSLFAFSGLTVLFSMVAMSHGWLLKLK